VNCVPVRSEIWSEKTIKAPPGLARSELSLTRIVFERAWELRLEAVPQKSTDFYPKLLSGETIFRIEGSIDDPK
jgi:hypothetical protein